MTAKTDNGNLKAKLDLRRHFLRKYHSDGTARVFDAFQGDGRLWSVLRKEFNVASYWGVDVKPRQGRLRIDCSRVLGQNGWTENVLDLDSYGQPWVQYRLAAERARKDMTIFLTCGIVSLPGVTSNIIRERMGLGSLYVPLAFQGLIIRQSIPYMLSIPLDCGYSIAECVEAEAHGRNVCYFGVRLNYKPTKQTS